MHKFLRMALKKAREHEYDPGMYYSHCALIAKGGKVLSVGYNQRPTDAFMEKITDVVKGSDRNFNITMHSECDAIRQVRNKIDLRGCKMYVIRIRRDNSFGNSRPCEICQLACANYGISKVYYSIADNEYGIMKISINNAEKKFKDFDCCDRMVYTGSFG